MNGLSLYTPLHFNISSWLISFVTFAILMLTVPGFTKQNPHLSIGQARRCLMSVIERQMVLSVCKPRYSLNNRYRQGLINISLIYSALCSNLSALFINVDLTKLQYCVSYSIVEGYSMAHDRNLNFLAAGNVISETWSQ